MAMRRAMTLAKISRVLSFTPRDCLPRIRGSPPHHDIDA